MLAPERVSVPAIPLGDAVEVLDFMARLGLGGFEADSVTSFAGRSDIWAGMTDTRRPVLVKRLAGKPEDVRQRLLRTAAVATLVSDDAVLRTPRCLGIDVAAGLAAFVWLDEAVTAAELVAVAGLSDDLAYETGQMIGVLHQLTPPDVIANDASEPPLPPTAGLAAITLDTYQAASAGELEIWAIVHEDAALADAIGQLRKRESLSPRTLIHGDFRLDQLLRHHGQLYLTDWEESRLADPARDVGAFVGECLFRSALGMASTPDTGDGELSADDVITNGVRAFEQLRPLIMAFWEGYRAARPTAYDDEDLAVRAAAFAGWHMFDRVWAVAHQRGRLSPIVRAAAGVGRSALLAPDLVTDTVGLESSR